jgi:DNA-binding CsgD family transcriptional regulator
MNPALTTPGNIEFFENDGAAFALEFGQVHPVVPGSRHYLIALEIAVSHPDYRKFKAKYLPGNGLVFGFIHDYLGGWNEKSDITGESLNDCDGAKCNLINDVNLTPREIQVVKKISEGYADKQVADLLHIATNTVTTILKNIRAKTGATSKYHIVSLAYQRGLI